MALNSGSFTPNTKENYPPLTDAQRQELAAEASRKAENSRTVKELGWKLPASDKMTGYGQDQLGLWCEFKVGSQSLCMRPVLNQSQKINFWISSEPLADDMIDAALKQECSVKTGIEEGIVQPIEEKTCIFHAASNEEAADAQNYFKKLGASFTARAGQSVVIRSPEASANAVGTMIRKITL